MSWTEAELRKLGSMEQAKSVGELLAERGKAAGVETCVFDRGGYRYHGRVAALAEGAREGGLQVLMAAETNPLPSSVRWL